MALPVLMPALSPTMKHGKIARWLKKSGDKVKPGDVLVEIETDKATMDFEATDTGILGSVFSTDGTPNVSVNTLIAIILENGEDISVEASIIDQYNSAGPTPSSSKLQATESVTKEADSQTNIQQHKAPHHNEPTGRVFVTPLAKVLARNRNIDLSTIKGSGPSGRIMRDDVLGHSQTNCTLSTHNKTHDMCGNVQSIKPITQMRRAIASRLLESKITIPHFYMTFDCYVDNLLTIRETLNKNILDQKISVNDIITKAVSLALAENSDVNSSWTDDGIIQHSSVDVSIAVSVQDGLITPIVKCANQKSLLLISKEIKELSEKAKNNKLKPDEFQGGSVTISNLGMYGIKQFSAIINPPQSCIIAVGAKEERVIYKDGAITTASIITMTLSGDHRIIDGVVAARFAASIKKFVEQPELMLLYA